MVRRVQRFAVVLATLTAVFNAIPVATAAFTLVDDIKVTSAVFTPTGAVRLTGSYVCPSGYAPSDAFFNVYQVLRHRTLDASEFAPSITCDGTRYGFTAKFPTGTPVPFVPSSGPRGSERMIRQAATLDDSTTTPQRGSRAPFRRNRPMQTIVQLIVTNGERELDAWDYEMSLAETRWAAARIADIEFTDTGAVRLIGSYLCPDGFEVGRHDSTGAVVSEIAGPRGHIKIRHFNRRVDCDGTWNQVAVKFRETRSGDPFQPDVEYYVSLDLSTSSPEGFAYANYADTLTIQA